MNKFKEYIDKLDEVFKRECDALCELDSQAGDGDHGLTISRGFDAANKEVKALGDDVLPSEIFKTVGYAMLGSMGGASGPIFSSFFIQAAIGLKNDKTLTAENFREILRVSAEQVSDLTETVAGEKTMLDALYGANIAVEQEKSSELEKVLLAAVNGAQKGSDATKDMVATKGRARFLGEASRGFIDAGSVSIVWIMKCLYETFQ